MRIYPVNFHPEGIPMKAKAKVIGPFSVLRVEPHEIGFVRRYSVVFPVQLEYGGEVSVCFMSGREAYGDLSKVKIGDVIEVEGCRIEAPESTYVYCPQLPKKSAKR